MKEITLNIPSSWHEVSIKNFTRLMTLSGKNPYEDTLIIISILSGEDVDSIRKLPATWFESYKIAEKLAFLQKDPPQVMPLDKFEINGNKYNVALNPSKWTAAQYLDYNAVLNESGSNKIARLIACFSVPEGKKYGEDYDFDHVVNEIFEYMPITIALGYSSFFHLQLKSFTKAIQRYTEKKKKRLTRRRVGRLFRKAEKGASTQSGIHS